MRTQTHRRAATTLLILSCFMLVATSFRGIARACDTLSCSAHVDVAAERLAAQAFGLQAAGSFFLWLHIEAPLVLALIDSTCLGLLGLASRNAHLYALLLFSVARSVISYFAPIPFNAMHIESMLVFRTLIAWFLVLYGCEHYMTSVCGPLAWPPSVERHVALHLVEICLLLATLTYQIACFLPSSKKEWNRTLRETGIVLVLSGTHVAGLTLVASFVRPFELGVSVFFVVIALVEFVTGLVIIRNVAAPVRGTRIIVHLTLSLAPVAFPVAARLLEPM